MGKAIIIRDISFADVSIGKVHIGGVTGYVTSGLVAHWDGIDKNNNNDSWKWGDLISGNVGTANASIFNHGGDYALLSGRNYLNLQTNIPITNTNYTIEICYDKSTGPAKEVFLFSGLGGTNAYAVFATWGTSSGDYIITGRNSNETKCWVNSNTYPQTVSVVNQRMCIINEHNAAEASDTNYLSGESTINRIAAGPKLLLYPFAGKIYSIRVYDRPLTRSEIINNQKYDKIRFGL